MADEKSNDISAEQLIAEAELDLMQEEENNEAVMNREAFEKNLANIWGYSTKGIEAKKAAMRMLSTKNGMYARIPIMCKAEECPYKKNCSLLKYNLAPAGEPCPVETAQIECRYAGYAEDFDLDSSNFTDRNLVSELINCDVMLERCKGLLASEGVMVADVVAGITEQGEVYTRPEVSKHWEAYERVQRKRNEIYTLMLATRKDKKGGDEEKDSLSQMISEIVKEEKKFIIEEKPTTIVDAEEINEK